MLLALIALAVTLVQQDRSEPVSGPVAAQALAALARTKAQWNRAILVVQFHKRELAPWRYDRDATQSKPRFLDNNWRRTFVVRDSEITAIAETVNSADPLRVQKRSFKGGQFRHTGFMSPMRPGTPAPPSFEERDRNPQYLGAGLWRELKEITTVLGVGCDLEFSTIRSARTTASGYYLEGLLREERGLNPHGPTDLRLQVDRDGLVRRLEIRIPQAGFTTLRVITTEGNVDMAGLRLAKQGRERHYHIASGAENEPPPASARYDLHVEFLSFRCEFSDEEYRQLTDFDTPNHSVIWDHGAGVEKYRDHQGRETIVRPLLRPASSAAASSWLGHVVIGHAFAFLLAAAAWVLYRWKTRWAKSGA